MITFYDIASKLPDGKSLSPNTWKTRYCLNYKGLEYRTEWVETPDIEPLSKKLGIPPTDYREDGTPSYTLPAIHDSSTGVAMADSFEIAKYLDKTYPDTPQVLPEGSRGLQHAFVHAFMSFIPPVRPFVVPKVATILNPRSFDHYNRIKAASFGVGKGLNLQQLVPQGAEREEKWAKFKKNISLVNGWYENNGGNVPYIMGDRISFADFVVSGYMIYLKVSFGEDSEEWKDIKSWDGGRWDKLVDGFKSYETFH